MFKAILFDMDGVIFDSRDSASARFKEVLWKFGYEMPGEREAIVHKGGTDREILLGLLPDIGKRTLGKMVGMAAEITSPLKYLKLNPGAKEAIGKLSKTRKLAIVSNDNRPNVTRKLEMFGLKE